MEWNGTPDTTNRRTTRPAETRRNTAPFYWKLWLSTITVSAAIGATAAGMVHLLGYGTWVITGYPNMTLVYAASIGFAVLFGSALIASGISNGVFDN